METIVAYIKGKIKSKYSDYLTIKNDLKGLEEGIKKYSEEICKETLKSILEDYDLELKLDKNRNEKYVVQRTVSKNITSVLGTFRLNRTRYYDKGNDCYFCLLDKKLNIPEYEHMTALAMARMLEVATNSSYRIAGKEINSSDEFSKGMIYQKIKRIEIDEKCEEKQNRRKVKVLYINLDEDHVAVQKSLNRKLQCKIGYVYEDVVKVCKNRYKLTNKHTICGTYLKSSGNRAFYDKINEYIECNYDTDYLEKVIVYGDGANWIKACEEYLPKCEFRLDKFHLMKSILEATRTVYGNRKTLKKNILKCLYENKKEMLIDLFDDVMRVSYKPDKTIQIKEYLLNNWDAIQRTLLATDGSGCSAEGNVSHILSARLSQKGMGWCEHNADVIGKLRGIQANDEEKAFTKIAETYYYQRTHYCEHSEVITYRYTANPRVDINKSYIDRIQTTIPDYEMNRRILKTPDIY